jgi:hypothetical protein
MALIRVLIFILAVLTLSCEREVTYTRESSHKIGADFRERAAAFILQCATAANPHSDEEGEDLVRQCEYTATRLYARTTYYCVVHIPGREYPMRYRCDSEVNDACKRVCGYQ